MAEHVGLSKATRDLLRVLGLLPKQENRGRMMHPDVRAMDFDPAGRSHEHWCDEHQQPVTRCHRAGILVLRLVEVDSGKCTDDGKAIMKLVERLVPCAGASVADVADPVGTAVAADEEFLQKVHEFEHHERAVVHHAAKLLGLQKWFLQDDPTDEALDALAKLNAVACDVHLRYGFVRKARSKKGTRVRIGRSDRFVFDVPKRLCDWCEDVAQEEHREPTEREVRDNAAGKRRKKEDRNPNRRAS